MSKYIGRLVDLGIAKESSRGGGAAATFWVPKNNITVEDKASKARSRPSYGVIGYEGNQAIVTQQWAEGVIDTDLRDKSFGLFLLSLLGTVVTTGPSDSLYTHTFSLQNDSQHDSLAISVKESDVNQLMFKLAMIESLQMTIVPDDTVKISVNFMAKKSVGSSHTVTYSAENKFIGRHLTFKIAAATGNLAAASNIPVKRLVLNFNKRLKMDSVTGTVEPVDFLNQAFSIDGEVEMTLEDRTYRGYMVDGSYKAVRVDLTNDQVTIGASSNPSFTIDLSRVDFEEWESQRANDDISMQTFSFHALYDTTNGNIINSCTLKNAQSSY